MNITQMVQIFLTNDILIEENPEELNPRAKIMRSREECAIATERLYQAIQDLGEDIYSGRVIEEPEILPYRAVVLLKWERVLVMTAARFLKNIVGAGADVYSRIGHLAV